MKRILIATGIFPPDIGGPATYGHILAGALISRDFDVRVITYSGSKKTGPDPKLKISKVSKSLPKGIKHLWFFLKAIFLVRKSDTVLALNAVSAGFPASLAARLFKKRFVVRIAGDYAWEMAALKGKTTLLIDDFQTLPKRGFLHSIQVFVAGRADNVIVPSEYLKSLVAGWGINPEKIKVIYNGVDFKPADLSKEEARTKLGIHGNIILSVGRLVPWKGFRMLIKAMPKLIELNQFFRLVIVGDGPERKNLEAMAKNIGLDKKINIAGKKSSQELALYMAAADVFILNSSYEGFSHQILEAMKAGVPVIVSAIRGNREIVRQGENGFLVKYNDEFNLAEAVKTLHQNPDIKEDFIQGGKKTVEKFSVEKMIEETVKFLTQ